MIEPHEPYGASFTGFKTTSRNWPSLLPPHEVDHNSQTVQSCVPLEKTWRLHHQFQEIMTFLRDASHPLIAAWCFRYSRSLLSSTPKLAAALRFPFSSPHRITSRLNFAVCDSLLDLRRPSSITMEHDKLDQAPPTFQQLRSKLASDKIAYACWERPASRYRYDSSAPGVASDFNAVVTSNIIQSVALWARGGWRKGAD
jgi:hypothetical protein